MKPAEFEYARPTSIADAVRLLAGANGEGKVLAGGQSLVPLLNFRLSAPALLVDINRIEGFSFIREEDGRLEIGAGTTTRTVELDPLTRRTLPILAMAMSWVGHVQIRNRGTVGGSIAHADPAAELPAICVLLDAEVVVAGPGGTRTIPALELFAGFFTTTLAEDEVLTAVRFPLPAPGMAFGFREFAHRRGDFALAGAAVGFSRRADEIDGARISVFGTADRPRRAPEVEATMHGRPVAASTFADAAEEVAGAIAADDPRPDAAYRRKLTANLIRRAFDDAAAAAGGPTPGGAG